MFRRSVKRGATPSKRWVDLIPSFVMEHHKEAIGIIGGSFFAFLSASILSFSPYDQSFFYFDSDFQGWSNWCGMAGAYGASLFFFFFGTAAYVIVPTLWWGLYSWLVSFYERFWIRAIALPLIVVVLSCLPVAQPVWWGVLMDSGFIGVTITPILLELFGSVGTVLILYTFLWLSAVIVARISFITLARWMMKTLAASIQLGFRAARIGGQWALVAMRLSGRFIMMMLHWCWNAAKSRVAASTPAPYAPMMIQPATPMEGDQAVLDELAHFARLSTTPSKNSGAVAVDQVMHAVTDAHIASHAERLSEYVASNTQSTTASLLSLHDRFAHKQLFTKSYEMSVGKRTIHRLPNTVLSKNMLTLTDDQGRRLMDLLQKPAEHKAITKEQPFVLPDITVFQDHRKKSADPAHLEQERKERGKRLEEKLQHFGIKGEVVAIHPGPVITVFEYKPDIDSKISKIIALEDDLAMALTALSIRIVAPIPGKNVVGFEIANQTRQDVYLADILQGKQIASYQGKLPVVLGVDTTGLPVIEDMVTMPHLLVAGSTGSGKSVGMHAMLVSMLSKCSPDNLKLILVDPKRLEFAPYADIPHLLFPIVTNMRAVAPVLKWVVHEMENRYEKMSQLGVRNVAEYHKMCQESGVNDMPYIVVMIDELADLMMVAGKEVEAQLARIAQMARAAGIHMIVATQRPSVDVVTGVIKVNFPSRIAFRVSSKIDSRTILDSSGAEKLLGRGDMLFMHSSSAHLRRVHGAYVSEKEVEKLANYLKAMRKVEYLDLEQAVRTATAAASDEEEPLYGQVCELLKSLDEVSISMLQRHLRIGFNRSARLMERLEADGLIAPAQGSKPRKVIRS